MDPQAQVSHLYLSTGDKYFKPFVISEPEIRIIDRHPHDDCLIVATNGLWDVMTSDLACNVARQSLVDGNPDTDVPSFGVIEDINSDEDEKHPSQGHCKFTAALLARMALARNTTDNVSVIVVDLRRGLANRT